MNPRKLAKQGFVNEDVNKIKCYNCKVAASMRSHLNFSSDEKVAKQWYNKIKGAHAPDCIFKRQKGDESAQANFPLVEFTMREFDP